MDINSLSLEESQVTDKNGETKTYKNRFNNTFKCLICNSEFRCRSHLKSHIMRTEKCGLVTNDDMIDDIKNEFAAFLDEFEAIPKTQENLTELNKVYAKLRKRYHAIVHYSEFNDKAALLEGKKQLENMKNEISEIAVDSLKTKNKK